MSRDFVVRASLFHLLADPAGADPGSAVQFIDDAGLWVRDGLVHALDEWRNLEGRLATSTEIVDRRDRLVLPGFVDTHVHFPQTAIIGSYGESLLEWLEKFAFPEERRFADRHHGDAVARLFLDELLANGTTAALVFCTVHPQSVEALFSEAERRGLRLMAGKVLMDRNAPPDLVDTPQSAYADSRALIEKWHGRGRLGYAVTPRFAPTSSPAQLDAAARLLDEFPGVYLHTHLSENHREIDWVRELYPGYAGYLDVYHQHRLTGERSVFAHSIHLDQDEVDCLSRTRSAVAFCPTSNLFLGSGLFDHDRLADAGIRIGMGTDVGGGTSFSMLETLGEAYKVIRLRGDCLDPLRSFYLATLGGAAALSLDDRIGNLEPGKEADFIVIDARPKPLLERRLAASGDVDEQLFALMTLGDDRVISETYSGGARVHSRHGNQ